MGNRTAKQVADKWISGLAPSMFESGQWAPGDDRLLVAALQARGAVEEWQAGWDGAVPGRSAEQVGSEW